MNKIPKNSGISVTCSKCKKVFFIGEQFRRHWNSHKTPKDLKEEKIRHEKYMADKKEFEESYIYKLEAQRSEDARTVLRARGFKI